MITKTYNPESDTVTIETEFGTEEIPFRTYLARAFVTAHLHWNGVYKSILSLEQQEQAYLMCDGFGNLADLHPLSDTRTHWDWSHIRDSSYDAFEKVADWIASVKWVENSLDKQVQHCRDNLVSLHEHGCTDVGLLELVPGAKNDN